jgi:flagellar biosynthesis anti-sigma factor FlgM
MEIDPIHASKTEHVANQEPVRGHSPIERVDAAESRDLAQAIPAPPADTVEISERSRELARALEQAAAAAETRGERVAELREKVQNGTYSVPAELLAERLLGRSQDPKP